MAAHLAAAISVSSSSSASPAPRPAASAVPRHPPFAASQAALVRPSDGLAAARLSGLSSTSGRCGCRGASTIVCQAALFQFLNLNKGKDKELVKGKLLTDIARLDRGADATPEDKERIDKIARELESLNPTKEPLKSPLINGKWLLVYTTSESILKTSRQKFLRPNGPIYQAINADTLRAQNLESWPYFNQVTANLDPVSSKKVVVNFDFFKIGGLLSSKNSGLVPEGIGRSERRILDRSGTRMGIAKINAQASCSSGESLSSEEPLSIEAKNESWCGLCGSGSGWISCGKCMGKGGFATKPGLAGVKQTVGWARCKSCFGKTLVPCILCGLPDVGEWERWQEGMRHRPVKQTS